MKKLKILVICLFLVSCKPNEPFTNECCIRLYTPSGIVDKKFDCYSHVRGQVSGSRSVYMYYFTYDKPTFGSYIEGRNNCAGLMTTKSDSEILYVKKK